MPSSGPRSSPCCPRGQRWWRSWFWARRWPGGGAIRWAPPGADRRGRRRPPLRAGLRPEGGLLVTPRQSPPHSEAPERGLNLVARPERREDALASAPLAAGLGRREQRRGGRLLDVKVETVARGERREARVASVRDDRLEARQRRVLRVELLSQEAASKLDVVRLGRLDRDRERQSQDLDEDRPLRASRVAAASAGFVEGRAGATALHGLGVDHHHRRVGLQ